MPAVSLPGTTAISEASLLTSETGVTKGISGSEQSALVLMVARRGSEPG
jgi:hypothetical protein